MKGSWSWSFTFFYLLFDWTTTLTQISTNLGYFLGRSASMCGTLFWNFIIRLFLNWFLHDTLMKEPFLLGKSGPRIPHNFFSRMETALFLNLHTSQLHRRLHRRVHFLRGRHLRHSLLHYHNDIKKRERRKKRENQILKICWFDADESRITL